MWARWSIRSTPRAGRRGHSARGLRRDSAAHAANAERRGKEQIRRINIPLGRGGHIFFACWRILSGCVRNRLFGGKGIFNISCFYSALFGKLPDNAILSHDLIEGCYLRAGFAHDITLFDEEPGGIFAVVEAAAPLDTRGLGSFCPLPCAKRGMLPARLTVTR